MSKKFLIKRYLERPSSDSRAKRRKRQDFVGKYCEDSSDELSESCTSGSSYNPSGGGAADTDSSSQDLDSEESPPDNNETNGEKSTSENQKRNNSLKLNSNKVESSSSIIISEDKSGNQNRSKTIEKSKVKNNSGTVSEKDRIECCYLYKQGTKIELLTERYGVQADAIRSWRRKYAPETLLARNNSKYDKNTILEACRKLKKGESIASVASKMGISTNTISRWKDMYFKVRVQKGESRSSCKYSEYTKLEALDRLHRGIESRVVAKDLKINVKLVLEWKDPNYSPLKPVTLREEPVDQRKYDKNFIRKVCERILRGESGKKIARELGMSSSLLSKWRHKYCLDKKPEPTNGVKYNKSAILKACELLKQGVAIKDVAQELQVDHYAIRRWKRNYLGDSEIKMFSRKYHSIETVLRFAKNLRKHETSTVLEAYKLMKKGNSSKDVANKLKLDCALVSKWRRDYFVTDHLPRSSKLKDVKVQVCERLRQGDPVRKLSKEFELRLKSLKRRKVGRLNYNGLKSKSVIDRTSNSASHNYNLRRGVNNVQNKSSIKSKGKRRVFVPFRKIYIPRSMKLQFVKMIEEGVSITKLSRELNINQLTITSWILNKAELLKIPKQKK